MKNKTISSFEKAEEILNELGFIIVNQDKGRPWGVFL